MFGKYQNVFRSRWKALWWSAGILLTAYCTVPSPDEADSGSAADASEAALIAQLGAAMPPPPPPAS